MNKPLSGKNALITGGAKGIGKAIAKKLAHAGCNIAINYYSSGDEAESLAKELGQLGVKACTIQANVGDAESITDLVNQYRSHFDTLDILVNNAASGVLKPALEMKLKHWRWCMEINAFSLAALVQSTQDIMQSGGRVIALTSLGSQRAVPNYAFIGASKAALESLVRSLSIELAPTGVTVNTISAGAVDTDSLKYFPNHDQVLDNFRKHSLIDRDLSPDDVANVAYLLCLPEAEMIKGQVITVDAGYSIIG